MLPAFALSLLCFWVPCKAGFRTRVAAKRRGNAALAPLFSNLVELEQGAGVIRAMGLHAFFFERHCRFHDEQTRFSIIGFAWVRAGSDGQGRALRSSSDKI